jgi:hypothetical protein
MLMLADAADNVMLEGIREKLTDDGLVGVAAA